MLGASTTLVATSALFGWGRRRALALASRGAVATVANGAPPEVAAPATIAFLGDVQKGVRAVARPVVAALARERAVFLVSSGDLASHGEAPYHGIVARAFERAGLTVPLLVAAGNHDVQPSGVRDSEPGRRLFERLYGPRTWFASVGRLLVIGCDNGGAWLDADQLQSIERRLDASPGQPWLLVIHRPPRNLLAPGAPSDAGHERLIALFERRRPEVVVSGHLERDMEAVVDGVRYVVNADGGDTSGDALRGPTTFRLLLADVAANGGVSLRRLELPRQRDRSVALDQFAVRLWADSRRGFGRVVGGLGDLLWRPFARR